MSTPVTRGELRQELTHLATKAELAHLATKAELEICVGALLAHIDRVEQRLIAELARHARALHESMLAMFAASDEKYS